MGNVNFCKNEQQQQPIWGFLHCPFGFAQGSVEMTVLWEGDGFWISAASFAYIVAWGASSS